jgi:transcriptional regulator with XRE-family HTH domain
MEQHSFGYWLRLKRKALDLTREGLADRVGCSAATIRKIEAEERRPSVQIVGRLADILDVPPDERTAFLRFARGDWTNTPGETTALAPWRAATISTRSNLPAVTTSLVGREIEIARVREYLLRKDIRLLTLIGPPGIGKTRLGLETARQTLDDFPGGVFFVALAPIEDPSLIAPVMVRALGYVEAKDLPAEKILVDGIGGKQMLIVLDNCEHLIENIAPLTSDLLSACPHLKIIATSRESLRIPGEWLYTAPALDFPTESSPVDAETVSKFPAGAVCRA